MDRRTLSALESRVVLSLEAAGADTLDLDDIQRLAEVRRGHARKLASILVRKGWIQRLGGGRYLLNPARFGSEAIPDTDALRIGSRLVAEYYFGYATAASLNGLTSQISSVYTLATPLRGARRVLGPLEFRLVHLGPDRFYGRTLSTIRGVRLWRSDSEKTVIDCLDRPDLAGGIAGVVQILHQAKPHLDYSRLWKHLVRFPDRSLLLRMAYLLDHVRAEFPSPAWLRKRLQGRLLTTKVWLGGRREYGAKGQRDADWNIIVNVPDRQLFSEVDVR
jgi:predicted transcriptional regulator of viral defense system